MHGSPVRTDAAYNGVIRSVVTTVVTWKPIPFSGAHVNPSHGNANPTRRDLGSLATETNTRFLATDTTTQDAGNQILATGMQSVATETYFLHAGNGRFL